MLRCVIGGGCLLYDYYSCTMAMIGGLMAGSMTGDLRMDGLGYDNMNHVFLRKMYLGKSLVFVTCIFIVKAKL